MTTSSSTNGLMFSGAALAASCAADLIVFEMKQEVLDQEAKKMAQECQANASQAMGVIALHIGQEQKQASVADGWASISSGIGTGGAEVAGMGYGAYRAGRPELAEVNQNISNNKEWRDALHNKEGIEGVEFNHQPQGERPNVEDVETRLREKLTPNNNPNNYPELKADATFLHSLGRFETGSALRDAREHVKDTLEANQNEKKSFDSETDDMRNKLRTLGQVGGQLASGAHTMERGRHQALQGEQECLKQLQELVNSSARGNADTMQKLVDQRQSVKQGGEQMLANLIQANHV